jgi:K+-sensing histidine kinase KdpD
MVLVLPRRGTSLSRIRRSALLLARGALLTGAVTAAGYWLHLNSASAALLYLIAVVVQSLDCSFLEAAITSLLATSGLDYFFIEPRFTFNVQDPLDAVTLAGLLIVSLVITRIQARSRAQADESRLQRNSMESLYKVGQELLALAPDPLCWSRSSRYLSFPRSASLTPLPWNATPRAFRAEISQPKHVTRLSRVRTRFTRISG